MREKESMSTTDQKEEKQIEGAQSRSTTTAIPYPVNKIRYLVSNVRTV
jgi:hypothetical protein